jgi:CheY-like chemotaxis protein
MWNILIAEDDLEICKRLVAGLSKVAHCTAVHSGEEAVENYQDSIKTNSPFDFILLDVSMPIMDGFEALKTIRENEAETISKEVIIIMVTTYDNPLMDALNMGWDDFITKPADTDILIEHMQKLIGNPALD